MLSRRELLTGGVVGGVAGVPSIVEEQQADREGQREIAAQIGRIAAVLGRAIDSPSLNHGPVAKLRGVMELYLRGNAKFPDFCEVGIGVFYDIYDWHVKHRQQLVITQQPDNRYTIQFMLTTLVVRVDTDPTFIGVPYDKA